MRERNSFLLGGAVLGLFFAVNQKGAWAQSAAKVSAPNADFTQTSTVDSTSTLETVKKYIGVTYFTFFDGPGLGEDFYFPVNSRGNKDDTGWTAWTNLSVRLKFSERYAIDYQFRIEPVLSNDFEVRSQGGRLGISGTLLKGEDWRLTGALNSDIPGVGQVNKERTIVVNPGLFSQFSYKPKESKWSVYGLVAPRFWVYRDSDAMDFQSLQGGARAGEKPEIAISLQPSINYALSDKSGLRAGILLDFRKNANQDELNRWFMPVDIGYTYEFNSMLSIYPHVRFSGPWDDSLRREIGRSTTAWVHTASVGVWLNGTIL